MNKAKSSTIGTLFAWRKYLLVKRFFRTYGLLLLVAGTIILLDQLSKAYIRAAFPGPEGSEVWAPWDWMLPYARILHVSNTGVAFGMFQGTGVIFATFSALVSLAILWYFPRVPLEDKVLRFSMSMMLGGAVGNLIDRITNNGRVTDFISVGSFPVFNVADSSITIGVIILMLGMWVQENRQKREKENENRLRAALESDSTAQDNTR
jgi:signal peptidase II